MQEKEKVLQVHETLSSLKKKRRARELFPMEKKKDPYARRQRENSSFHKPCQVEKHVWEQKDKSSRNPES
jgi:hypothetical protein